MTKEFPVALRDAMSELDKRQERSLDERLKDVFVHHFAKFPTDDVPDRYRPQYRVLKNRLEDFFYGGTDEGEESARQIERQLRGLLETATASLR